MYSLTSTLSTASEALNAASGAIAVTNNNISNVNTPGYSRQTVNLSASALQSAGSLQDNGVTFGGYNSVRDEVLQLSISQKTSDSASLSTQSAAWAQIESAFSGTTTGLGAALNQVFSALSSISTAPTDPATRQATYGALTQLTDAFHQAASTLSSAAASADSAVAGAVQQVNQLSSQIASLDQELSQQPQTSSLSGGGALQDQRDALVTQLAQLVGVKSIQTEATPTLSLSDGTPLVIAGSSFALQVSQGLDGTTHILNAQGQDVTSALSGGSLGGELQIRDQAVPQLVTSLNDLTSQFATAMNAAQASGFDLSGAAGQPVFVNAVGSGAAANISVSLSSASQIAASSDGSPGSSANISNFLSVASQALPAGQTPSQLYASLVQTIGLQSANTSANLSATQASLTQLNNLQSSQSGVSIDEETTNLLRYQQAYSAAAQVINTLNSLFSVVMDMSGAN